MLIYFSTKRHLLMIDLVAAFVLFIFMLVLLRFLCCYRFSVIKIYIINARTEPRVSTELYCTLNC